MWAPKRAALIRGRLYLRPGVRGNTVSEPFIPEFFKLSRSFGGAIL